MLKGTIILVLACLATVYASPVSSVRDPLPKPICHHQNGFRICDN